MPYIEPSTIESVKQIDLFSYLRERDPDELVRISASTYATKTHDSLKISHGKWFWWSRGFGGRSALDYLIKVRDMSFMDAVKLLNNGGIVPPRNVESAPVIPVQAAKQPFCLPPKSGNETAIRYLESRGIDRAIIDQCIDNETVYRSVTKGHSNVVFVGKDEKGFARYAAVRGCCGDYKGEASGSDKRHAFKLNFGSQTNCTFFNQLLMPCRTQHFFFGRTRTGRELVYSPWEEYHPYRQVRQKKAFRLRLLIALPKTQR